MRKARTSTRLLLVAACVLFMSGLPTRAFAGELLFSQTADGQSTYGPSQFWPDAGVNSEVADDFDVTGSIDRVVAAGFIWGLTPQWRGVSIRFYQYNADGTPGALQREYFLAAGDPNLVVDNYGLIDATLAVPFPATGRHFLAVQPSVDYWYWWSADTGAPRGQAFYFRNLAAGQTQWQHGDNLNFNSNADVSFALYGAVTGPGQITSLAATTLPRSGYLEILGSNFGGDGTVLVDGLSAPVADWQSTRVVAYVPEAARLATVPVQVVNPSGQASNTASLTVTARQAADRVNWRFRMNGPYSRVRPAVAADGTVYAIDAFGHLYALAPDGGLRWLVRGAGDKGVAVGADGDVYVASESFVRAFHPDGTAKWTFEQNPRALTCLGISVGPDGNIYSVSTEGLGVFSLTPQGALRWTNPEPYRRPIVEYGEIVFGPNGSAQQLYFYANQNLRAVRLDGSSVFSVPGSISQLQPAMQPAVAPDGSVHTSLTAFAPNGSLLWTFPTPYPYNVFTEPMVGSDGNHYFVQNLSQLFSLKPGGTQRWHVTLNGYAAGPIVDPLNTQLVMGSADTGDHAGFIFSTSATDGHELWRVVLPIEDPTVFNPALGIFGFNQFVDTRARFSADGQTAYIVTATATGDNNTSKSFVYSINAGGGAPPPPTSIAMRSTAINLSAKLQNGVVTVTATVSVRGPSGAAISGAATAVTWTLPDGTMRKQSATTGSGGNATFSATGGRGKYTLTVSNITKAGYTFDRTNSVLSKSITK